MASNDRSLVSFKIFVGGEQIKEGYDVTEIKVTKEVNRIASARLKLLDGSVAKQSFDLSGGDDFVPGKEIEIQAGFGLKTKPIFKGIIISQNIQSKTQGCPNLIVECRDKAVYMTLNQNSSVYLKKKDSAVMQTLVENYGLSPNIEKTENEYPQIVQYNSTDWDFLISRVEVNGLVVVTGDNEVKIAKPDVSATPVESLSFGSGEVFEFEAKMDARNQFGSVKAQAWDYKNQKLVEVSSEAPSVPEEGNISGDKLSDAVEDKVFMLTTTAPLDQAALQTLANARLLKSRLAKVQGKFKAYGNAALNPNEIIKLDGLGDRFDGNAYVSGVVHEVKGGNWWSYVNIGLDPNWFAKDKDISSKPASGLLPGIGGLQNGTVKQIYEDPGKETRIEVEVPVFKMGEESNSVWARWVQPYATNSAGMFFMPEIGDEVVLGFLNDDPRYPIVLGSLYSSKNAPPLTPADKNPKKAIISKSQLTVEFDDDKKILTLSTPGGNSMVFSDEDKGITIKDQNGNEITMGSGGIALKSPSDIKLTADGEVTISGTGGLTMSSEATASLEAQASLSVSGLDVSISGEASLAASGGGETSISADGELSLGGAMIMIN